MEWKKKKFTVLKLKALHLSFSSGKQERHPHFCSMYTVYAG